MISQSDLEELLAVGHETTGFEVKGPGSPNDKPFLAKVTRACAAMGNLRDGGVVCIGIDDDDLAAMLPGLSPDQLREWMDYDLVSAKFVAYIEPPLEFEIASFTLSSGAQVAVIAVSEFRDVPHLCKKQYPEVLRRGAVYVRPRGGAVRSEEAGLEEMRELIDLATDKRLREFVKRSRSAGLIDSASPDLSPSDTSRFDAEAETAWSETSPPLDYILERGHWDVAIRPLPFEAKRLRRADLANFVEEHAVRLRGWPVPYINPRETPMRGDGWVGQDIQAQNVPHAESWRMATSGQFLQRRVIATDMVSSAQLAPTAMDANGALAAWDVLFYLTELLELAARMAVSESHSDGIELRINLRGMYYRQLISGTFDRELNDDYLAPTNEINVVRVCSKAELLQDTRRLATEIAADVMDHFGFAAAEGVLEDWQSSLVNGH